MRILVLSDGIPGHDRSSQGILAALARHRLVEAHVLPIREKRGGSRRVRRVLAGMMPFRAFWERFYRIEGGQSVPGRLPVTEAVPQSAVDLVVSTGPRTAAANIAMARHLGSKNVYFGFSKWPSDSAFTVLLTPEHRRPHPHRAYALRPSEIDAADLPPARPLAADGSERHAALLFGGQSKHYRYTMADMELLGERIVGLARELPWLKWTVYDSRRTPEWEFDRMVEMVGTSDASIRFVRFANAGLASNNEAFACDLVLVSADSMSMVAESIAAGRPTGILFADRFAPPKRDATELQALIVDRRAFRATFSALGADVLLRRAAYIEPFPGSQLETLYQSLVSHGL
jgi:mitochondrial fission protein ELM1